MDENVVREFQNATYAFANAIGAMAEILGMHAENQYRIDCNETIAFDEAAFIKVMTDRGLYHNSLMKQIYDR